jgi:hypothetical protein
MKKIFFIAILVFISFFSVAKSYAAISDRLGNSVSFFVDSGYDISGRKSINATLRKISNYAYFYIENNYFNSLDSNERNNLLNSQNVLAEEFDNNIYPKLTEFYGEEWNPGIDEDSRITILFTPMISDAGGYFRTNDEFSKNAIQDSNEREMIFFNAEHIASERAKALIAHEIHHIINFYQKNALQDIDEEVWLNEMRSEYAPTIAGYDDIYSGSNTSYREKYFMATPNNPLVEWKNESEDYGVINFFAQYAANLYGGNIFASMIKNAKSGIASFNKALKDNNLSVNFSNLFLDWAIANILNDCSLEDGRYCYNNENLKNIKIDPTASYTISSPITSISVGGNINDWSARWYKFSGSNFADKTLRLNFQGTNYDGDFHISYIVKSKNGATAVKSLELVNEQGFGYIKDFGDESNEVIVVLASLFNFSEKLSGSNVAKNFTLKINVMDNADVPEEDLSSKEDNDSAELLDLPDGSLARAVGDYRVYIINGKYKRHILDGRIFDFYNHLSWNNVHEVDPLILSNYKESFLIRAFEDEKVYEINGDKTRHWLNMSAESFTVSGRDWTAISIVNKAERDFYVHGADVRF